MSVEVVRDLEHFSQLCEEWGAFVSNQTTLTPFQTPVWLLTWWKHFGNGELRVFIFRCESAIAAVIPCFLHTWHGRRQLTLIGSGVSDYLEPPMASEHSIEVTYELANCLIRANEWDVCNWQDLDHDTAMAGLARVRSLYVQECDDTPSSEIPIRGTWDEFYRDRPHGLRRNLRRYLEKAERIDKPEFVVKLCADSELIDALIRLHAARWLRHGESGMIRANGSEEFLREATAHFSSKNMLRLFALRFQGKIVSVILSFSYGKTIFPYLSGFDPEYEEFGFGRLLLERSLHYAFENKYYSWNFLRGNEPYKFDWGAQEIRKTRLIISRESVRTDPRIR